MVVSAKQVYSDQTRFNLVSEDVVPNKYNIVSTEMYL